MLRCPGRVARTAPRAVAAPRSTSLTPCPPLQSSSPTDSFRGERALTCSNKKAFPLQQAGNHIDI